MIPYPNQPFDFGYSDTCNCIDEEYSQFFFNSDTIQAAFQLEPCEGDEPINLGFAGEVCYDGPVRFDAEPGFLNGAGLYRIRFNVPSYTSGSVEVTFGGNVIGTITGAGIQELWHDKSDAEEELGFFSTNFVGCIQFTIEFQIFKSDDNLFLVDNSGNIYDEFAKVRVGNSWVFSLPLPSVEGLVDCLDYRLGWFNGCNNYSQMMVSNTFRVTDEGVGCTVALSGCYPGNQLGWPAGFQPLARLKGRLYRPNYEGEIISSADSGGYRPISYAARRKTMQLGIDPLPEYLLDYVSVWVLFEQMYINGESWRVTDNELPEVIYTDGSDLGQWFFTVERVRQNVKVNICRPLATLCLEIPPPPNVGTPKQFMDDEFYEFQDDTSFEFQN